MRHLILAALLLCACACDATKDTTCAPAYTPGTAAYRTCMLRNGQDPATTPGAAGLHPQFLRPQ